MFAFPLLGTPSKKSSVLGHGQVIYTSGDKRAHSKGQAKKGDGKRRQAERGKTIGEQKNKSTTLPRSVHLKPFCGHDEPIFKDLARNRDSLPSMWILHMEISITWALPKKRDFVPSQNYGPPRQYISIMGEKAKQGPKNTGTKLISASSQKNSWFPAKQGAERFFQICQHPARNKEMSKFPLDAVSVVATNQQTEKHFSPIFFQ